MPTTQSFEELLSIPGSHFYTVMITFGFEKAQKSRHGLGNVFEKLKVCLENGNLRVEFSLIVLSCVSKIRRIFLTFFCFTNRRIKRFLLASIAAVIKFP